MPDFADTFGADYLTLNPDIVFGTAMLGRQFGVIKQAGLKRTGLREEIINDAGELVMLLIKNPGWEMMLTCAFDRGVSAPGLLESITLPFLGIQGRVMEGAQISWDAGSERTIMIPVNAWDVMNNATAYRLNGGQRIVIGRAGVAPQSAPALSVITTTASSISIGIGLVTGAETYRVETSTDGAAWTLLTTTAANFATLTGLPPRAIRYFRARGQDGEAPGPWSARLTGQSAAADAAPTALPIPAILHTTGGTRITWPVVAQAEEYDVEYKVSGGEWTALYSGAARECFAPVVVAGWESMTVSQRQTAFFRQYRIRAKNSIGVGSWRETAVAWWLGTSKLRLTPVRLETGAFTWEIGGDHWNFGTGVSGMWAVLRISSSPDMAGAVELDDYWTMGGLTGMPGSSSTPAPGTWYPQGRKSTWASLVAAYPGWIEDGRILYVQARLANTRPGAQPGGVYAADYITQATDWGPVTALQTHPRALVARYRDSATVDGTFYPASIIWSDGGGNIDNWRLKLLDPASLGNQAGGSWTRYDMHISAVLPGSTVPVITRDLARGQLELSPAAPGYQAKVEDSATNASAPGGYKRYICAVVNGVEGPPALLPVSLAENPA